MHQNLRRQDRGFTLVELMIVVAVIGVIASLAIPNYMRFTARTKRSEMLETVSKIKLNFKNIADNSGTFVTGSTAAAGATSGINPSVAVPVGQSTNWDKNAAGWTEFQFPPDGAVKMRYWYTMGALVGGNVQDITITVCGSFGGLGSSVVACPPGMTGTANYRYDEVFHANGSSDPPTEFPAF
jgi:type IV pilus assembly protein PilA